MRAPARPRLPSFRPGQPRRRLLAVVVVASVLLVLLVARVVVLQTIEADDYRAASVAQRRDNERIRADRGVIFDRNGAELAMSVPSSTVYADPALVTDPAGTAATLATMLGLTPERQATLAGDLAEPGSRFVYVARQVDESLASTVMGLELPGVDVYEEPKRVLLGGDFARAIVGRTDPDGNGTGGLEMQYDDLLTGIDGRVVRDLDSKGRSIPTGRESIEPAQPGEDLVLTLDRSVQFQVEQSLLARVSQLKARQATAIVMDSETGDVYAMVSVQRGDDGVYRATGGNLAVVEPYEPGSVAKVITLAAALNEGAVSADTTLSVPYKKQVDEFEIKDAYPHNEQPMTVRDILVHSSNIGTLMVGQKLGTKTQVDYMQAFGFGEPTALGFPGESAGILKDAKHLYGSERLTVSYGYGFAATPLQLAAAVNVVANDGVYVAPRLVAGTIDDEGVRRPAPASPTRTVLRHETAAEMTSMMTDVVCQGTATLAQLPEISVAGKTGTSYKAQNGAYVDAAGNKAYRATFVGFLPAEDPKVTILVSIDEPDPTTRDRFGGTAAAPVFTTIAQVAIHELKVRPPVEGGGCPATT